MIKLILYGGIALLIFFAYKLFRLLSDYRSGSRPNISDLKDRAEHLKSKYKNVEEADFRDVPTSEDESESSKQ